MDITPRKTAVIVIIFEAAMALTAISAGMAAGNPAKYFGEFTFITWFSFFQLLFLSMLSHKISTVRSSSEKHNGLRSAGVFWNFAFFGFFFLALDELVMIHEVGDILIHTVFNIEETGLTDRLDDLFLCSYGIIGLIVLYLFIGELKKYRAAAPFVVIGFILFFFMVATDTATNRDDVLTLLFADPHRVSIIKTWSYVVEDYLKILGEGFFIAALFVVLQQARHFPRNAVSSGPGE